MSASVFKINEESNGPVLTTMVVPVGETYRLVSVSVKFDAAPVTSENLTITLDANAGPGYDVLLYSVDPAAGATTDILWQPDEELFLEGRDAAVVAYPGTDGRHAGVQITAKAV